MFLDACEHVSRITRVIRFPKGNALLMGIGGSGRQSCTKMATYIADYKLKTIEIIKGYAIKPNWVDDLSETLI